MKFHKALMYLGFNISEVNFDMSKDLNRWIIISR